MEMSQSSHPPPKPPKRQIPAKYSTVSQNHVDTSEIDERGGTVPSNVLFSMLKEIAETEEAEATLPRRNRQLHTMEALHAQHKAEEEIYHYGEYVNMPVPTVQGPVVKQLPRRLSATMVPNPTVGHAAKKSSLMKRCGTVLTDTRIPHLEWTVGTALTLFIYLAINALCLWLTPNKGYGEWESALLSL
jgi:hypothetical protein